MIFFWVRSSHAEGISVKRVRRVSSRKIFAVHHTRCLTELTNSFALVFFCTTYSKKEGRRARRRKPPKGSWQCNIKCFAVWSNPKQRKNICEREFVELAFLFFGSKITSAMGVLSSLFAFHSPRLRQFLVIGIDWRTSFYFDALSFASTIFILRLFLMSFLCAQKGALTELELS